MHSRLLRNLRYVVASVQNSFPQISIRSGWKLHLIDHLSTWSGKRFLNEGQSRQIRKSRGTPPNTEPSSPKTVTSSKDLLLVNVDKDFGLWSWAKCTSLWSQSECVWTKISNIGANQGLAITFGTLFASSPLPSPEDHGELHLPPLRFLSYRLSSF